MNLYREAIQQFKDLYEKALQLDMKEPTSLTLATVDKSGQPHARVVLLKGVDDSGFVFYTNKKSHKAMELAQTPKAALCFYWPPLDVQVRVEGMVEDVSQEEADGYWSSRARESQIGAWASMQSEKLSSRPVLLDRYHDLEQKYDGKSIPRPAHWSGYRVKPFRMEFWKAGPHRLHERTVYEHAGAEWTKYLVYP